MRNRLELVATVAMFGAFSARAAPPPVELAEKACAADDAEGCHNLGLSARDGKGIPKDDKLAARMFERACTLRDADACSDLALMRAGGKGLPADPKRARADLEDLCKRKAKNACENLAFMLLWDLGGPKDAKRAASLYERACADGSAGGCSNLAVLTRADDPRKTAWALERACRLEPPDGDGCAYLGEMVRRGEGIPVDKARAVELFAKACRSNSARGCTDLGASYAQAGDVEKARRYMTRGCELGDGDVCEYLKSGQLENDVVAK